MSEEESIREKLDKVLESLEKKEDKKFKLPFFINMQKGKTLRKNYAIVLFIRTNGAVEIRMVKIEEDTVKIGDIFYDARASNVLRYKKYPLLVIAEWNMLPFNPQENLEQASKEGTLTAPEGLILTKMKLEAVKPKATLNAKVVLIVIGALIIGYFVLDYLKVF